MVQDISKGAFRAELEPLIDRDGLHESGVQIYEMRALDGTNRRRGLLFPLLTGYLVDRVSYTPVFVIVASCRLLALHCCFW